MCPAGEIAIRILHAKEKEKKKNIGCAAFVFTYDSRVSVPFLLYPKLHSSLTWVKGGNQGTQHSLAPGGGGGGAGSSLPLAIPVRDPWRSNERLRCSLSVVEICWKRGVDGSLPFWESPCCCGLCSINLRGLLGRFMKLLLMGHGNLRRAVP